MYKHSYILTRRQNLMNDESTEKRQKSRIFIRVHVWKWKKGDLKWSKYIILFTLLKKLPNIYIQIENVTANRTFFLSFPIFRSVFIFNYVQQFYLHFKFFYIAALLHRDVWWLVVVGSVCSCCHLRLFSLE